MLRRALIAVTVTARLAVAQSTPFVAPNARVYDDISRLAAAGLIDTIMVAARPYSRREVTRLLHEAQRNLPRLSASDWASKAIAADLAIYDSTVARPIDYARAQASWMSSPDRPVPTQPTGGIDARINPLGSNRDGYPIADGASGLLETMHSAELGPHVALSLNPLFYAAAPRNGNAAEQLRIQSGEADLLFGNMHLDVGRGYALFGEAPTGALALSTNAPALDMVRISNDMPARAPFPLRFFGPAHGTVFIADLGKHQRFPYSQLVGWRVSFLPVPRFEWGVEVIDEMGGRGSPPASFGDRVLDPLIVPDVFRSHSDFQFSNKMVGGGFRLRVPTFHGFELYAEGLLDDFDHRRVKSSFLNDGGGIAGFDFTCIVECGRLRLSAEYHQTGIRYYTHGQFTSGITENGLILGDQLGPRARAGYVTIDVDPGNIGTISLEGALEVRNGNVYNAVANGVDQTDFHFVLVELHPAEKRARVMAVWRSARDRRMDLRVALGAEDVQNFQFVGGDGRRNAIAQAGVEVRP